MASANTGATDSLVMHYLYDFSILLASIVLVTITCFKLGELQSYYIAFPEKIPCVTKHTTSKAPFYFNSLAASPTVLPVSIISSIIIAFLFFTSPIK